MELPFPTDILQFAVWLAINGLTLVALLEKIPAWHGLSGRTKAIVVFVLVVGAPVYSEWLAALVKAAPAEQVAAIQHYLDLLLNGLRLWAASQYAHGGVRMLVAPQNPGPLPPFRNQ